jgi:hypothetical protein
LWTARNNGLANPIANIHSDPLNVLDLKSTATHDDISRLFRASGSNPRRRMSRFAGASARAIPLRRAWSHRHAADEVAERDGEDRQDRDDRDRWPGSSADEEEDDSDGDAGEEDDHP